MEDLNDDDDDDCGMQGIDMQLLEELKLPENNHLAVLLQVTMC